MHNKEDKVIKALMENVMVSNPNEKIKYNFKEMEVSINSKDVMANAMFVSNAIQCLVGEPIETIIEEEL